MGREGLSIRVAGLSSLPSAARKPGKIAAAVARAFALEGPHRRGEVSIVFVSRSEMRSLNLQYLGHDYDTDVVTFQHEAVPGVPSDETPLGDIYISSWMAARQARELGHGVLHEALTLAVHGALHLLGHDDQAPRRKALMFRRQDEILAELEA